MKFLSLMLLILVLGQKTWAIDSQACQRMANNQHIVHNINSKQAISTIYYKDAVTLFNELKKPKYKIPYLNADTNCDSRGHVISQTLHQKYHLSRVKVFLEPINEVHYGAGVPSSMRKEFTQGDNHINFQVKDINHDIHTWGYHTAPAVCVRKNGKDELYIFDLSLFKKPVPYSTWQKKITGGISKEDYRSYTTSMYNFSRISSKRKPPQSFLDWDTKNAKKLLAKDWPGHVKKLNRKYRQNKTIRHTNSQTGVN